MQATGYARRFPANAEESVVRQLAMQLGVSHREAMTWMGVLKQVLWRERAETKEGSSETGSPESSSKKQRLKAERVTPKHSPV
jgi:hypothetical protein